MNTVIENFLKKNAEPDYAKFSSALLPNAPKLLGVRLGKLRKFAKELAENNAADAEKFARVRDGKFYEIFMLRGMTIGALKMPFEKKIALIENFLPQIDNWGVCDSFCSSIKIKSTERKIAADFAFNCAKSPKTFIKRFGYVMLMKFVGAEYDAQILASYADAPEDDFYAVMGAAWGLCECCIKAPEKTRDFLSQNAIGKNLSKALKRKIADSFRISTEFKRELSAILLPKSA